MDFITIAIRCLLHLHNAYYEIVIADFAVATIYDVFSMKIVAASTS